MSRAAARLSRVSAPATGAQNTARAFIPASPSFTTTPSLSASESELRREEDGDEDERTLDEEKSVQEEDLLQQLDQVCSFPSLETNLGNLNLTTCFECSYTHNSTLQLYSYTYD